MPIKQATLSLKHKPADASKWRDQNLSAQMMGISAIEGGNSDRWLMH